MRKAGLLLLIACAVVVAFAVAPPGEDQGDGDPITPALSNATETPADDTPTPTSAPETVTTKPAPDNPWRDDVVVVGYANETASWDYGDAVRRAVEYWNERGIDQHTNYTDLRLVYAGEDDRDDWDVNVSMTSRISTCGDHYSADGFNGCAPLIEPDRIAPDVAEVDISDNMSVESTRLAVQHELGHVLGIDHNAEPLWLMVEDEGHGEGFAPNARERKNPWNSSGDLRIAAVGDVNREGVGRAVEYYNRHPGHNPTGRDLLYVKHWQEADVVVWDGVPGGTAQEGVYSQTVYYGYSWDSDETFERWVWVDIHLKNVDGPRETEHHVGFQLSQLLGNDEPPEPYSGFEDV